MSVALHEPAPSLRFSWVRDQRHTTARAADDLMAWLSWLELGGASEETLAGYEWSLAKLLRHYPEHELGEFTTDDLMLWLRTYPPRSWRTRSAPAVGWFKWAKRTRRIADDPAENLPRLKRHKPPDIEVFTAAERDLLEGLASSDGHLMAILFGTGIRRGEGLHMRAGDVQTVYEPVWNDAECEYVDEEIGGRIVVRNEGAKGGSGRRVTVGISLVSRLVQWFELDGLNDNDFLWAPKPGGHRYRRFAVPGNQTAMGDTSFMVWWQRCLKAANVRYRKPHTTRHTYATSYLRAGGKRETLRQQLGHASTRTIDVYEHLDESDVRADVALLEAHRG